MRKASERNPPWLAVEVAWRLRKTQRQAVDEAGYVRSTQLQRLCELLNRQQRLVCRRSNTVQQPLFGRTQKPRDNACHRTVSWPPCLVFVAPRPSRGGFGEGIGCRTWWILGIEASVHLLVWCLQVKISYSDDPFMEEGQAG